VSDEEILDSPVGWVRKHLRGYVESDGAKGHRYYGRDALLLTTRGRRSGKLRRTPLFYGRHGDAYVVVASNGGAKQIPLWVGNIDEDPDVTVQVRDRSFPARARRATPEERPALWELMNTIFPSYAGYERKAGHELPVVVIEPR
jgi:deazaflavin-dependent oxidoreductase (nitroreductase family)